MSSYFTVWRSLSSMTVNHRDRQNYGWSIYLVEKKILETDVKSMSARQKAIKLKHRSLLAFCRMCIRLRRGSTCLNTSSPLVLSLLVSLSSHPSLIWFYKPNLTSPLQHVLITCTIVNRQNSTLIPARSRVMQWKGMLWFASPCQPIFSWMWDIFCWNWKMLFLCFKYKRTVFWI